MTPCPVCRGGGDPDCPCEGSGYVSAEMIQNVRPTFADLAWFWGSILIAFSPWALIALLLKGI